MGDNILLIICAVGFLLLKFVLKSVSEAQVKQETPPEGQEGQFTCYEEEVAEETTVNQAIEKPKRVLNKFTIQEDTASNEDAILQRKASNKEKIDITLKKATDAKRAFIYSEIFNRKY